MSGRVTEWRCENGCVLDVVPSVLCCVFFGLSLISSLVTTAVVRAHGVERAAPAKEGAERAALLLQPVADRPRRHQLEKERRHLRRRAVAAAAALVGGG